MDASRRTSGIVGWVGTLVLAGFLLVPSAARAVPYFLPNLPDFYQHQLSGPKVNVENDALIDFAPPDAMPASAPNYDMTVNWWEDGFGWCCVTAFVNSFYYLEKRFNWPGLFTRPGGEKKTWQEQMVYAIEDMAIKYFGLKGPGLTLAQYAKDVAKSAAAGAKGRTLSFSQFTLSGGKVQEQDADATGMLLAPKDISGTFSSLFDVYRQELCKGQDVEIKWEFPSGVPPGTPVPWWAPSLHVTTGAGVADCKSAADTTLWFADPDKRNDILDGAYLPFDVREPYPDDATLAIPVGEIHYDEVSLNASGCITSGIYTGACITTLYDVSVVPEPGGALVLLSGLTALVDIGRRRSRALASVGCSR